MQSSWSVMQCIRPPLALVLAVLLQGCAAERADPAQSRGSTLALLSPATAEHEEVRDGWGRELLFVPLLRLAADGTVEGGLARSWARSADAREWVFRLRTDVRWHDGAPVTARDLAFTLELQQHPDVRERSPVEVVLEDDSTLRVVSPRALSANQWAWQVTLPEHLLRDQDPKHYHGWAYWNEPVGNGAFRFRRRVPRTLLELEANPEYFEGAPRIDRVLIKLGGGSALTELLAGNVDRAHLMNPGDALKAGADPRFELYPMYWPDVQIGILWRNDHPLFEDRRVRRALTLGLDRRELVKVVGLPAGTPLSDAIHTDRQMRTGELPEPLPYDPEQARRLLAEAGWRDTDGNGILDRDGTAFRFPLLAPNMGFATQQSAVVVKDQLRRIGVDVEIVPLDYTIVLERLRRGDYAAMLERVYVRPAALTHMFGGDGANVLRFRNDEFSRLAAEVGADPDADHTARLARLTEIFREELPATVLFPMTGMAALHRRVRGHPQPSWSTSNVRMENLWIESKP
jgi:peptide/nickel transport system substrate-binding protein